MFHIYDATLGGGRHWAAGASHAFLFQGRLALGLWVLLSFYFSWAIWYRSYKRSGHDKTIEPGKA